MSTPLIVRRWLGPAARAWTDAAVDWLAIILVGVGAVLAAALLRELLAPIAADPHHDFLAFYAAGRLVLDGNPGGLYLASAITAIERTIIPGPVGANGYMPFVNPPFAAVLLAPFGALPPQVARMAWAGLGIAVLAVAAWLVGAPLEGRRRIAASLLVVLSYPALYSLAEGQWSALMLLGGIAALRSARAGSWRLAGLALATWWLKPQLILLPLLALALGRRWTTILWAVLGGLAVVLASLPFVGVDAYATYVGYLVDVGVSHFTGAGAVVQSVWQGDLSTTEGINGLFVGMFGQAATASVNLLWAILVAGLLATWLMACRSTRPGFESVAGRRLLAAGIGIVLLANPNLYVQDCLLVFLLVPALWPVAPGDYWRAVVGVAAIAALAAIPGHLFTVALAALVIGWCLPLVGRSSVHPGGSKMDIVGP